jgi:4-carboxymuconolactone decarboxylase
MDEQLKKGLATRKKVVGEDFVNKSYQDADDIMLVLQDFVSRNAWGTVWQRDGLDMKIRSLVTVGMLIALGRGKDIASHVRGAIANGATEREVQEVLLHATVYAGFPYAIDAYTHAAVELKALRDRAAQG